MKYEHSRQMTKIAKQFFWPKTGDRDLNKQFKWMVLTATQSDIAKGCKYNVEDLV